MQLQTTAMPAPSSNLLQGRNRARTVHFKHSSARHLLADLVDVYMEPYARIFCAEKGAQTVAGACDGPVPEDVVARR
jgi:hypothetical protein